MDGSEKGQKSADVILGWSLCSSQYRTNEEEPFKNVLPKGLSQQGSSHHAVNGLFKTIITNKSFLLPTYL